MPEPTDKDRHNADMIIGTSARTGTLRDDMARALAEERDRGFTQGMSVMASGRARVLRLLEYVYPDAKSALEDQQHWAVQGVYLPSAGRLIRSTVLPMEVLD